MRGPLPVDRGRYAGRVVIDAYLAYDIENFVDQILWLVMLAVQTFAFGDALYYG